MAVDWTKHESPINRAKRLTQERVDAGLAEPWVMGDYDARDKHLAVLDRRAAFRVLDGGLLKSTSKL